MKKLLFIIIITSSLFAQSVSELQNKFYSNVIKENSQTHPNIITSLEKNNSTLKKTVFGYLPWWEYLAGNHQFIRWDLITHLAVFSFEADINGNLHFPTLAGWPWIDVIEKTIEHDVKLIMTVTNFNEEENYLLLTDNGKRQNLFNNIISALLQHGFAGVNIDFENIKDTYQGNSVRNFLRLLKEEMHKYSRNWEVSFATPTYGLGNWDFKGMSDYCDYLMIMGYDFYGKWANTTGPSAPLIGPYLSITNSIEQEYKGVPKEKIILGVPYYGNLWHTKSPHAYAEVTPYNDSLSVNNWQSILKYSDVVKKLDNYEKLWDNLSQTSWLRKKVDDSTWSQIWYDDSTSLALKYDLVFQKDIKGIGIWALGYDGNKDELWNLIEDKFMVHSSVDDKDVIHESFILYQNYPNPFNPETIISYSLPSSSYVVLKIYDILGKEIITLVNEFQPMGNYKINFSTFNLPVKLTSGIYFYRLTTGNFNQVKKMVLLR